MTPTITPQLDLALFLAANVAMLLLAGLHLAMRPELRNGQKPSRVVSYVIGVGVILGTLLTLTLARGAMCGCWLVSVFQVTMDAALIAFFGAIPTVALRLIYGEPRRGNPHRDLHELERKAKELTDASSK
jgi:hypothetical protein